MNMVEKRMVMLENYTNNEGDCQCGCGMKLESSFLVRLQAFVYLLELLYETEIRHLITSGARCKSRNDATPDSANFSQHLNGLAADGYFEKKVKGEWVRLTPMEVSSAAVKSRLFTGIGWIKYRNTIVHLDARKGNVIVTW